ncbi:MAG: helix-turn-helix domain-containing protein [Microbacterium sp.]|uniref:MarR family winged helix-turn-helix transcriptional regulator n=1 Tax=Microbacterium sp. TaxID=51671 RepID=UPI002723DC4F|nr:helix-turn-helix domain-containing protein [Microbacterium sp.]MDO8384485.1 helix-turn-helix domain-containing protein [Microbacterium sp.]
MTDVSQTGAGRESGLITEPLPNSIDPDHFTPRLLALLSNALVWRESHELRRRFGLGTNDWRVISSLGLRPGMAATDVAEFTSMNKAVVSKSVSVLTDRRLIELSDGPRGSRPMFLTRAGAEMHDLMMPVSLRGQEIVLSHLEPAQITQLNDLLLAMLKETRALMTLESEAGVASAARNDPA